MRASEFMRAIPAATRAKLPKKLQGFKTHTRPWLVQLSYADPLLHFEVVTLGERRGILEIGLHFERRDPTVNTHLLNDFLQHLFEIKTELGDQVEAEKWDRGWTKIYETIPLESYTEAYLDRVAGRLAKMILLLQPMLDQLTQAR